MSRLLAPRTLLVVTALLGLLTAVLAFASELDLALGFAGLTLVTLATLVWSAFSRIQRSLNRSDHTAKAVARLENNLDVSDRRLIAAIESLRRDVHTHDSAPSA